MGSFLEIPFELAGIGIERDEGVGVEIGAHAIAAVEIRRGIAGAPVDQIEVRIVGAGVPGGTAAQLPGIARPCFGAGLAGRGNRVEAPDQLAGLGVEGVEIAAVGDFASGDAGDDFILHEDAARS